MLLIMMNEWLGPGNNATVEQAEKLPRTERTMAFASEMPLSSALKRILGYQADFGAKNLLAIEYRLLSVSEIRPVRAELLYDMGVQLVEKLSI